MEHTLTYKVAAAIAGATDDPTYCALLQENDILRQKNHDLAQDLQTARAENVRLTQAMATVRDALKAAVEVSQ